MTLNDPELDYLLELHKRGNETPEQCLIRMVKLAVHLSEAIDDMAETAKDLWQSPR